MSFSKWVLGLKMNLKLQIKIAFGYFFIVALLGVCMRMFHVADINFNYKNILHTHSHIALLGWAYTALTTLIYKLFFSEKGKDKIFNKLFWSTQISIVGMMISFPFTGYAFFSIVFSTLFLLNSYVFVWLFLKHTSSEQKQTNSYKIIRTALWFLVFSSLGPWCLGVIMNTLGNTSTWYRNAIYFYLHFQYNGWFLVALIGILFAVFEKSGIVVSKKKFRLFYRFFISGVFLTFFLSILWMEPNLILYIIAGLGGILQLLSFVFLGKIIINNQLQLKISFSKFEGNLFKTIAVLFLIKLGLQLFGAIPEIAKIITNNIDLLIAYLHWVFLGIVSVSLFVFLKHLKLIQLSKTGYRFFLLAFILTESLLFYKGLVVWLGFSLAANYYLLLFLASSIFLIGIGWLFILQFKKI